jgi:hypothetical protein
MTARHRRVLNHDLLAERLAHFRRDDASEDVDVAAGYERHDHAHRLDGILLGRGAGGRQEGGGEQRNRCKC